MVQSSKVRSWWLMPAAATWKAARVIVGLVEADDVGDAQVAVEREIVLRAEACWLST